MQIVRLGDSDEPGLHSQALAGAARASRGLIESGTDALCSITEMLPDAFAA